MKNKYRDYQAWYENDEGIFVLSQLDEYLTQHLQAIFGYYAVEAGILAHSHQFLSESRISHCHQVGQTMPVSVLAKPEFLPIMADNIDLFIASHVLECSKYPHQVLREIDRVLVAEGHCFIIGFNPFSLAGLENIFLRRQTTKEDQKYQLRRASKTREWLKVLGFDIIETRYFGYRSACLNKHPILSAIWRRFAWIEHLGNRYFPALGSVYIIHAQKQVLAKIKKRKKHVLEVLPKTKPVVAINKQCKGGSRT